ncbi:MAG: valine--tRNA ligase, partial [Clostridia bacterium]|nr:valine--tRNA ligase [Clostridia bacterium]
AEMKVNASKKATLILKCSDEMKETFKKSEGYFTRLASASSVEYLGLDENNPEKSASAVTPGAALFIPMGELVDVDKELIRLNKELEGTLGEIKRSEGKLANPGFVAKAPANLIQQEKDKVEKNKALAETLRQRISELETLK